MRLTTEVLDQVYAIEFQFHRGGPMRTLVPDGGGPGAAVPNSLSVTAFFGTDMDKFHDRLNGLQIAAYRTEDSTLREKLLQYAKRVDAIRRFKTLEEGKALRLELQHTADALLAAGGVYIRGMFHIDQPSGPPPAGAGRDALASASNGVWPPPAGAGRDALALASNGAWPPPAGPR
jgi:hypothetical protein